MTENTDGKPAADKAGTEAATAQQPTQPADDSAGKGAEGRIGGLTAEKNRLKEALDAKEREYSALEEKYKTDEDKRIDELVKQRVDSEYGPYKQRLERIEAELTVKRDTLLGALPEESRNCFDESAPVEVQVRQIELVTSHLSAQGAVPGKVDSGANPPLVPRGDKRIYTKGEYDEVQRLAVSNPDEFDKQWPEMKRALVDGRIEGVGAGRIAAR